MVSGSAKLLRRRAACAVVAIATVVGAWLRIRALADASLWLDEILNVAILREETRQWYHWLIGFERENGPFYFALQAVALELPLAIEFAWRVPAIIFGIATIPLLGQAVTRMAGAWAGTTAAVLLAVSPLHVYYSREGRPYALLMCGAAVGLLLLTSSFRHRTLALGALSLTLAAVAATAVPLIAGLAVGAFCIAAHPGRRIQDSLASAAGLPAAAMLYGRFPSAVAVQGFEWNPALLLEVLRGFGSWDRVSLTRADLFIAAFAIAGALVILARNRADGAAVLSLLFVPLAGAVAALAVTNHWFSVRYVTPALPAWLALSGIGVAALVTLITRRSGAAGALAGTLLVASWVAVALPHALTRPIDRADWKHLARLMWERSQPGDTVLATSTWSAVSVRFYLDQWPERLRVIDARGSREWAEFVSGRRDRLWILHGGYDAPPAVRDWLCGLPRLAWDPVEDVSLFYAPRIADFLSKRGTVADATALRKAWVEGAGGVLAAGEGAAAILGSGWYAAETAGDRQFRWSRRSAWLVVPPGPAGERLDLDLAPFPTAQGGPSSILLRVEGTVLGRQPLDAGRQIISFALPERSRTSVAQLEYDSEQRPSDHGGEDQRQLAAMVHSISLGGRRADPGAIAIRIDRGHNGEEDEPQSEIPRELMSRMQLTGSALAQWRRRGRSEWELVAGSVTPRSCASDREWLESAYRLILAREADPAGLQHHLRALGAGADRAEIAQRLTR